jgi:CDP-paratose synthetase
MHKKQILITGATGYLGSNLVKKLLQIGYDITIVTRRSSTFFRLEEVINQINIINIDNLEDIFINKKIESIIHTATCYGRHNEKPEELIATNVLLPAKLLSLAKTYNVNVFINTDTSLPKTLNLYSLSKSFFKDWFMLYTTNTKMINVIPEYFYGPNDDVSKFISHVINEIENNSEFINFTSGIQNRDFIYIDDIVNAYVFILNNLEKISNFTNISVGTSESISLKELVYIIKEKLNNNSTKLNFGALPDREGDIMQSSADISILQSLGWHPQYNIVEGIDKTIKLQKLQKNGKL